MLNIPHIVSDGIFKAEALVNTDKPNIIVESIKLCEDEERTFIVRFYDPYKFHRTFGNAVKNSLLQICLKKKPRPPQREIFSLHSSDTLKF